VRIAPLSEQVIGERLGHAIFDRRGRILLAAGVELTPKYVEILRRRGYLSVPLHDPLAPDAVPTDVLRDQVRQEATAAIRSALRHAGEGGRIVAPALLRVVDEILSEMVGNPDLVYNVQCLRSLREGIFFHSVNVCVYTLIAAAPLALERDQLRDLGVGALLHDIGKVYYLDLVHKVGPLSAEEEETIHRHAQEGYELLRRQPGINLLSAHMAFQHHERLDGTGYPRGLRGEQIHPWAQAVAVADVYDTITGDRTYGKGIPPHLAMAEVRAQADAGQLSAQFVRQLMLRVAAYPEGTILLLGSGEVAVVVGQTRLGGGHPNVRVVADARLRLIDPELRTIDGREPESTVHAVLPDYPARLRKKLKDLAVPV
jgi:HD-GYP domain-containing protein (c-di-GMP phosphodiesterase class II)